MLGHATGRLLLARDGYAVDLDRVIAAAAKAGTAIEINANPHRLDLDDEHARRAKAAGVQIVINPDCARRERVRRPGLRDWRGPTSGAHARRRAERPAPRQRSSGDLRRCGLDNLPPAILGLSPDGLTKEEFRINSFKNEWFSRIINQLILSLSAADLAAAGVPPHNAWFWSLPEGLRDDREVPGSGARAVGDALVGCRSSNPRQPLKGASGAMVRRPGGRAGCELRARSPHAIHSGSFTRFVSKRWLRPEALLRRLAGLACLGARWRQRADLPCVPGLAGDDLASRRAKGGVVASRGSGNRSRCSSRCAERATCWT